MHSHMAAGETWRRAPVSWPKQLNTVVTVIKRENRNQQMLQLLIVPLSESCMMNHKVDLRSAPDKEDCKLWLC